MQLIRSLYPSGMKQSNSCSVELRTTAQYSPAAPAGTIIRIIDRAFERDVTPVTYAPLNTLPGSGVGKPSPVSGGIGVLYLNTNVAMDIGVGSLPDDSAEVGELSGLASPSPTSRFLVT